MLTYPILRLYLQNETIEFKNLDIVSARIVQEINPVGLEVPAAQLDIKIHTTDPAFDPFSSGYYYQALTANTKADLLEYKDGSEIYIGRFYLEEWDNPSEGILKFIFQDAIGLMENIPFDGTFYESPTAVKDIITDIGASAPEQIFVEAALENITLQGYIPGNINLREALQQVCFAAGGYIETKGTDKIWLKQTYLPHPRAVLNGYFYDQSPSKYDAAGVAYSDYIYTGTITDLEKTDKQKLKILPMVTEIELITHDYSKSATKETIFNDTLQPGDYKIIFPKPYGDVAVWGAGDIPEALGTEGENTVLITEAGGVYPNVTIIGKTGVFQSGSNHITLHITAVSTVLIEGYPYEDNQQSVRWENPEAIQNYVAGATYNNAASLYDTAGVTYWREWAILAPPNIWKITNGTLVNKTIGSDVLNKLKDYAEARYEQVITVFVEKEVQPGLVYCVDSLHDKKIIAVAELVESKLSDGYLKEVHLIGVEKLEE